MRKLKYQTSIRSEGVVEKVKSQTTETVFEVYWIHLKEHTDITTQGYVGITCQGSRTRFYKHLSDARNKNYDYMFHKALRKYQDSEMIVETICISNEHYAKELEYNLRPNDFIGWNTATGGSGNPGKLIEVTSTPEFAKQRSDYMLNAWQNEDYAKKMYDSRKAYYEETPPWRRDGEAVNHFAWSLAGICYVLKENLEWGHAKICNYLMVNSGSFCRVFDYFVEGWNPLEDADYQSLYPTPSYSEIVDVYGEPEHYHLSWQRKDSSGVWNVADDLYEAFHNKSYGVKDLANLAGVTWHQAHKIHRRFKNGWNPYKDLRWLTEFKGYVHEY